MVTRNNPGRRESQKLSAPLPTCGQAMPGDKFSRSVMTDCAIHVPLHIRGEVGCDAECYTHEKVEEELGPQETLCRSMGKREYNRSDHDSEWGAKLAFESDLEISAKASFLHERRNQ